MKKLLASAAVLFFLAGCTPETTIVNPPSPTPPSPQAAVCPTGQHSCACATGNYCLKVGAMCVTPESACPNHNEPTAKSYKNSTYNFQFDYPKTFTETAANYGNLTNKIVQVQLAASAYPKTNFGDAAFTVSEAKAKSKAECLSMNLPEGADKFANKTTIHGIEFSTATGNGAGAGNYYESKNYRTFTSLGECLELTETIHTSNIANYDPGTVSEVNKAPIWSQLQQILESFTLT